jgi:glycosyltransferase involved in cell wall biosynthesis
VLESSNVAAAASPTLAATLCNYNHGHVVRRAIDAILAQSRPPDEFVIVDDGSTDDSVAVIEEYVRDNSWIRFIRHPRNLGLNAAIDTALENASSDYLYMAASDDHVKPGFFEQAMALATRYPEAGVIFGRQMRAWESGVEELQDEFPSWTEPTFASPPRYLEEYLRQSPALHSLTAATIYRRSCLKEVGGMPAELSYWVDTFTARAIALKHGACFIPSACAVFSLHPNGFCGRQVKDPRRALAPLPHIVARMRSPELADRFPARYVDEWERESVKDAIAFHSWMKYVVPAKEAHHRRRRALAALGPAGRVMALVLTLPRLVLAVGQSRLVRWSLRAGLTQPLRDRSGLRSGR